MTPPIRRCAPARPRAHALHARIPAVAAALLALPLLAPACRGTSPSEPARTTEPTGPRAPAPEPPYRPALEESGRRIAAVAAEDGGALGTLPDRTARLDLPTVPPQVDVVAAHFPPARWVVAAVERDRVTPGLAGAERIFNLLNQAQRPPTAVDLARIIGALHYYPWRVYDGSAWTQTGLPTPTQNIGSSPQFVPRPAGLGRALTFTFFIPEGTPGAGLHVANFHVTDSGLIIDQAPNPSAR